MNQDKIYFFGYGANRDVQKIGKILGKTPVSCTGAILEGYSLFYQKLEQIPDPAKGFLRSAWGEDFKAYTINPGSGITAGVIWEITKEDLEIIKKWEFDGIWRQVINIEIKTFEGKKLSAFTDKAINSNDCAGFYDGLNYPNNLNNQEGIVSEAEVAKEDIYRIEKLRELRKELFVVQS